MKKAAIAASILAALLLVAAAVHGAGPVPITVKAGKTVNICKTGTIICPATSPICDDTSVATMQDGKQGMEIVGVAAGNTTCSAMSSSFVRVVYSVTVN